MGRTYHHTLTTELALSMVDIGEVVGNRDSLKLTLLEAERTADTGISTGLLCYTSLVLIDATDKYPPSLRASTSQFYDELGASFDASTAGDTLVLNDYGKPRFAIHIHSVKFARMYTVSHTEASPAAVGVPLIKG